MLFQGSSEDDKRYDERFKDPRCIFSQIGSDFEAGVLTSHHDPCYHSQWSSSFQSNGSNHLLSIESLLRTYFALHDVQKATLGS